MRSHFMACAWRISSSSLSTITLRLSFLAFGPSCAAPTVSILLILESSLADVRDADARFGGQIVVSFLHHSSFARRAFGASGSLARRAKKCDPAAHRGQGNLAAMSIIAWNFSSIGLRGVG